MTIPFICHVEWGTPQPEILEKFLSKLFEWKFQPFAANYFMYIPSQVV